MLAFLLDSVIVCFLDYLIVPNIARLLYPFYHKFSNSRDEIKSPKYQIDTTERYMIYGTALILTTFVNILTGFDLSNFVAILAIPNVMNRLHKIASVMRKHKETYVRKILAAFLEKTGNFYLAKNSFKLLNKDRIYLQLTGVSFEAIVQQLQYSIWQMIIISLMN
mgnify:FL=1